MRPLRLIAVLVVASFLLAACGSDSPVASSSPSRTAATAPASVPAGKSVEAGPSTAGVSTPASTSVTASSASSGQQQCAQQGDITIKIVLGSLDCASAYDVAGRVDRDGDKRQDVSGYVCEFGNATIRPTIFTCTNRAKGTEFAVDET